MTTEPPEWTIEGVTALSPDAARGYDLQRLPDDTPGLDRLVPGGAPVALLLLRNQTDQTKVLPGVVTKDATVVPHDYDHLEYGSEYADPQDSWRTDVIEALPPGMSAQDMPVVALLLQTFRHSAHMTRVKLGAVLGGGLVQPARGRVESSDPFTNRSMVESPVIDLGPWMQQTTSGD